MKQDVTVSLIAMAVLLTITITMVVADDSNAKITNSNLGTGVLLLFTHDTYWKKEQCSGVTFDAFFGKLKVSSAQGAPSKETIANFLNMAKAKPPVEKLKKLSALMPIIKFLGNDAGTGFLKSVFQQNGIQNVIRKDCKAFIDKLYKPNSDFSGLLEDIKGEERRQGSQQAPANDPHLPPKTRQRSNGRDPPPPKGRIPQAPPVDPPAPPKGSKRPSIPTAPPAPPLQPSIPKAPPAPPLQPSIPTAPPAPPLHPAPKEKKEKEAQELDAKQKKESQEMEQEQEKEEREVDEEFEKDLQEVKKEKDIAKRQMKEQQLQKKKETRKQQLKQNQRKRMLQMIQKQETQRQELKQEHEHQHESKPWNKNVIIAGSATVGVVFVGIVMATLLSQGGGSSSSTDGGCGGFLFFGGDDSPSSALPSATVVASTALPVVAAIATVMLA